MFFVSRENLSDNPYSSFCRPRNSDAKNIPSRLALLTSPIERTSKERAAGSRSFAMNKFKILIGNLVKSLVRLFGILLGIIIILDQITSLVTPAPLRAASPR